MKIAWNINEKSNENLVFLMTYLLKLVRISYEKRNEIAWNINEKSNERT